MLEISCTKKVAARLPDQILLSSGDTHAPLHWYANLLNLREKDALLLFCPEARFSVILHDLHSEDFADFSMLVKQALRDTLTAYGVKQTLLEKFLPQETEVRLTAAESRRDLARMGRRADYFRRMHEVYLREKEPLQLPLMRSDNGMFCSDGAGGYFVPHEKLMELLEAHLGEYPVSQQAYKLRATLDLLCYKAVREFMLPTGADFRDLHHTLWNLFGWNDENRAIANYPTAMAAIVSEGETWMTEGPLEVPGPGEALREHLLSGDVITYLYDCRDEWEIQLELLGVERDYRHCCPVCTHCEGAAPPENIGGAEGFADFWEAYSDPEHPGHFNAHEWTGSYWNDRVDPKLINAHLRI